MERRAVTLASRLAEQEVDGLMREASAEDRARRATAVVETKIAAAQQQAAAVETRATEVEVRAVTLESQLAERETQLSGVGSGRRCCCCCQERGALGHLLGCIESDPDSRGGAEGGCPCIATGRAGGARRLPAAQSNTGGAEGGQPKLPGDWRRRKRSSRRGWRRMSGRLGRWGQ